jgi:hypothetical protein
MVLSVFEIGLENTFQFSINIFWRPKCAIGLNSNQLNKFGDVVNLTSLLHGQTV